MFIDSHAHLDDPRFEADRTAMLERAWESGVRSILTIGNGKGPDDMGCGIPFAESYDWIVTTVGVHPHDASRVEPRHLAMMKDLGRHSRVVAIGEIGLDYHYEHSPRDIQKEVFRRQLEVASELDLPVVIHTRDADLDTMEILRDSAPRRGVIHCFTSGPELADCALAMGFMISFSGIVTFSSAAALADIARRVPDDRMLIETDAPYLAPVPHRGKRNEPAYVADTARFLAGMRNVSVAELAERTSANFAHLFSPAKTA